MSFKWRGVLDESLKLTRAVHSPSAGVCLEPSAALAGQVLSAQRGGFSWLLGTCRLGMCADSRVCLQIG